jgi:hypothetical protein
MLPNFLIHSSSKAYKRKYLVTSGAQTLLIIEVPRDLNRPGTNISRDQSALSSDVLAKWRLIKSKLPEWNINLMSQHGDLLLINEFKIRHLPHGCEIYSAQTTSTVFQEEWIECITFCVLFSNSLFLCRPVVLPDSKTADAPSAYVVHGIIHLHSIIAIRLESASTLFRLSGHRTHLSLLLNGTHHWEPGQHLFLSPIASDDERPAVYEKWLEALKPLQMKNRFVPTPIIIVPVNSSLQNLSNS